MQCHVRNYRGVVEEKRFVLVLANERERLFVDAVGRVVLSLEHIVAARIPGIGVLGQ